MIKCTSRCTEYDNPINCGALSMTIWCTHIDNPPWTFYFFSVFGPPEPPFIFFSSIISFLGSSLKAVVAFNLEVTHAARFALKTTAAFNEEPKKENLVLENGKIIAKNSRISGKNGVIFAYFCSQSTKSDICAWEITRRHE